MPNPIKYTTGTETLALKKGNFYIGTGDVGKGPSDVTGFYQGPSPSEGGYVIYMNREGAPGDLSYHNAPTDNDLITFTNNLAGQSYTTVQECLVYYASQSDKVVLNRDYEGIVTDGLVLNLDAGFTPSYSRSGTTWYDVSENENTSTLINGVGFSSNNGGVFTMDGSNDYIDVPYRAYLDLPTLRTTSFWVKLDSKTRFQTMLGQAKTGGFNQRKWDVRYGAASGSDQIIRVVLGQGGPQMNVDTTSIYDLTTQWYNISVTFDGSETTCIIYINGVEAGKSTSTFSTLYSSEANSDTTLGFNLGRRNDGGNLNIGNFANLLIYNRALSADEVLQNYNAQKGRFGL